MMCSAKFNSSEASDDVMSLNLQQRFFKKHDGWYVNVDTDNYAGPYSDKADAQMALMYYNVRTFWPSAKQLRAFVRKGF